MNKSIMLFTAHPDDNILVTGTLLKLKKKGWSIHEVVLTTGSEGINNITNSNNDLDKIRNNEILAFSQSIGYSDVNCIGLNDGFIDKEGDIIKNFVTHLRRVQPSLVILPFRDDYHADHRKVFFWGREAIELANRSAYLGLGKTIELPIILEIEGLNLISHPDLVVDISDEFKEKMDIIKDCYPTQIDEYLFNFIKNMNCMRGNRIKTSAGEAYTLVKIFSRPLFNNKKQLSVIDDLLL